ncbi:MAG: polymerase, sigma 28 subunit, Sig subfamily [Conexibacter sp.]|nr:polymerase, sigma 28 subunit, Sig subfamily [Conexibacter sp.]
MEELVARYRRTGDPGARDLAIRRAMPLARRLASRYHRGKEPLDDLVQVAYLGLVKAVDRFDPEYGAGFGSFAIPTISGELRRYFRDTSWSLHVPRGVQEAVLDVARASTELSRRLGRPPTISQLAEASGLDCEQISEALHARAVQETTSLDQPRNGEDGGVMIAETIGREDANLDLADHLVTLGPLLRALPAREREILFMRFAQDLTQSEIAERVGCSQMQVSRLLRRSITRLREASDEPPRPPARRARRRAARMEAG